MTQRRNTGADESDVQRRELAKKRRRAAEKQRRTVSENPAKSMGGAGSSSKRKSAKTSNGSRSAGSAKAANGTRSAGSAKASKGTRSTSRSKASGGMRSADSAKAVYSAGGTKGRSRKRHSDNRISKRVGLVLCAIQFVATFVFLIALMFLNMLPMKYLGIIAAALVLLWALPLVSQLVSKKKAIAGKILSVLMSIILAFGSFYVFKTNGTVQEISGGGKKVDKMVVAVLADDPAENISDAANYEFGVQYALKGDDVRSAVASISEETGTDISTEEFNGLNELAEALHDETVRAIIYNDAYTGILEESFENYSQNVKIIYEMEITTHIENNRAAQVEVANDSFTVYISGIDVYGAIETNSRSDVNIMAVVNPSSHQILLVTTPRDYYVEIPDVSGGAKDKLTHAGIYGVDASMATLESIYDTEIDFYARVNFTSMIQIVDALGGVDVNSEVAFTTSEDPGPVVNIVQGINHLNGTQALAFSRERYNLADGDYQRGKNQQAVITAMIKKAISPAILAGANEILSSISGNVDTNMTQEQIQDLIKAQLADMSAWSIKSMAAEGTGDSQACYSSGDTLLSVVQPNWDSVETIKQAIGAVENGEILPDSELAQ